MKITYKPDICEDPDSGVTGHLEVKVPTLVARYDYMDKAGMNIGMDGNVKGGNLIKAVKYLAGAAKEHISDVKITAKGKELSSYEDLMNHPDGQGVLQEVAMKLMSGFSVGNA